MKKIKLSLVQVVYCEKKENLEKKGQALNGGAEIIIMVVLCYHLAIFLHRREHEECRKLRTDVGGWIVVEISDPPKCTPYVLIVTYQPYDTIQHQ